MTNGEEIVDIEFKLSEVFDKDDMFDLIMLSVFAARDDIYKVIKLAIDNEHNDNFNFVFKLVIGITSEAYKLLFNLFESSTYKERLALFDNWIEIKNKYSELTSYNDGNDKDAFSVSVLKVMRDQTFHYAYKNKDLNKVGQTLMSIKNSAEDMALMTLSNIEGSYNFKFIDVVYWQSAINLWEKYAAEDFSSFAIKFKDINISIAQIFNILIEGYLRKQTNLFCDDFDGTLRKIL